MIRGLLVLAIYITRKIFRISISGFLLGTLSYLMAWYATPVSKSYIPLCATGFFTPLIFVIVAIISICIVWDDGSQKNKRAIIREDVEKAERKFQKRKTARSHQLTSGFKAGHDDPTIYEYANVKARQD